MSSNVHISEADLDMFLEALSQCEDDSAKLEQLLNLVHTTCRELERVRLNCVDQRLDHERCLVLGIEPPALNSSDPLATYEQISSLDDTIEMLREIELEAVSRLEGVVAD